MQEKQNKQWIKNPWTGAIMQQFQENDKNLIISHSLTQKENIINKEINKKVRIKLLLKDWELNATSIINKANS